MQPVTGQRHWEIVPCDVMGPYPTIPHGNQYLLVITDHFSKWVELIPLRKLVRERIWRVYGKKFPGSASLNTR